MQPKKVATFWGFWIIHCERENTKQQLQRLTLIKVTGSGTRQVLSDFLFAVMSSESKQLPLFTTEADASHGGFQEGNYTAQMR
ncbi:hypothetical protein EYF80_007250 [Liparis tanakae]|uniref:Uncharacterized protein n=1 Tax=Liparis tanakae TaxID=230148 RepID=A0A4Z2IWS9_9TELE|nr:hypothetical protein EYF80_007250 [Liparis tanakae]